MTTQTNTDSESRRKLGRYSDISVREARAAARVRVTIDQRRGRKTLPWIVELANRQPA